MDTRHLRIPPTHMPSRGRGNVASRRRTALEANKEEERRRLLLLLNQKRAMLAAMSVPTATAKARIEYWLQANTIPELEEVLSISNGHWTSADMELEPYLCPQWGHPRTPPEGRWLPAAFIIAEYRMARQLISGGEPSFDQRVPGKSDCMPNGEDLEDLYQEVIHQDLSVRKWFLELHGEPWEGLDEGLGYVVATSEEWDASYCPDPYKGKSNASTQYHDPVAGQFVDAFADMSMQ